MTKAINAGDKVRVLRGGSTEFKVGDILTVLENDYSTLPYYCENANGDCEWMKTSEVELVPSALEDRVAALEYELAELKASLVKAPEPKVPVFDTAEFYEAWSSQTKVQRVKSLNELRKEAVDLAKDSVASSFVLDNIGGQSVWGHAGHNRVEFVVNEEARTVVALLRFTYTDETRVQARGVAKCDPTDVFNEDIGKAIALDRALERATDERILRAPNPDEVVPGMVAEIRGNIRPYVDTIVDSEERFYLHSTVSLRGNPQRLIRIISDTDAQY